MQQLLLAIYQPVKKPHEKIRNKHRRAGRITKPGAFCCTMSTGYRHYTPKSKPITKITNEYK
jgi:hypothetical protein